MSRYKIMMAMMENNYIFIKKYISNHRAKRECSCNLYIERNEEFQFIWQALHSRERQMPYPAWGKLT